MIDLPKPGMTIEYQRRSKEFKVAYMGFMDFETIQCEPTTPSCSCKSSDCQHKTKVIKVQKPVAYSLLILDRNGKMVEHITYAGEDASRHFLGELLRVEEVVMDLIDSVEPMVLTAQQEREFQAATVCYLCHEPFDDPTNYKCRDHDHLDGKYLGASHSICNLHRSEVRKLPIFCHNFSGFDSHLLVEALAEYDADEDLNIQAVPLNQEKFKMMQIGQVVLLDSLAFLNASLDNLVKNLTASHHKFPILEQFLPSDTPVGKEKKELILRKGVFPYQYLTDVEKLRETSLPPKEAFFSDLTGDHITQEEMEHAQKVWQCFDCQTFEDYLKLYVMADVVQLAEAMVEFRDRVFNEYNLDICHFWSAPMLTKDVALRLTHAKIELLSDMEMIDFFKGGVRGGLSMAVNRHVDVAEEKEKRGEDVALVMLDVNSLYGKSMCFPLPIGDYAWMTEEEISAFDVTKDVSPTGDTGYAFEVRLEYPEELHADHNSFPLGCTHLEVDEKMLSPYALNALQELTNQKNYKARKLTSTLETRDHMVLHGLNLQLYLELGLRLVKIYKGIKFSQTPFLKQYIDHCSQRRAAAPTKTGKTVYKTLMNSLYGKMIENQTNRLDCRFVRNRKKALRRTTDPRYRGQRIINDKLSVAFFAKPKVHFRQMLPQGFSILELSKYFFQSLYYKMVRPTFKGKVSLVMTDTDSWLLLIGGVKSADEAVAKLSPIMDCSNYDKNHPLYNNAVENLPGYLKNEAPSDTLVEAVALRSKAYAIRTLASGSSNKCKGVKRAVKDRISFESYRNCVLPGAVEQHHITQHTLQSKNHVIRLVRSQKRAFSSFDDKRILLCSKHSVPYGSKLVADSERLGQCVFCANPSLYC